MRSLAPVIFGLMMTVISVFALIPSKPVSTPPLKEVIVYLVFDINHFAPSGGFGDFVGSFKTIQEATSYINRSCGGGSAHVVEINNDIVAFKFNYQRIPSGEYLFSGREVFQNGRWVRD